MTTLPTISDLPTMQQQAFAWRAEGKRVGFIPTMGALHRGHLSLIEQSVADGNDIHVVSIYVNPTQFGPREDLAAYPRTLETDAALAKDAGANHLFLPSDATMYPDDFQTEVLVRDISKPLCGVSRPHHFPGVALVLTKLFNLVLPHRAYFGVKDFQQCLVVEQLVRDLNLPVEVVRCPTVREDDGLALSSRNSYLTPKERPVASRLRETLLEGRRGLLEHPTANVRDTLSGLRPKLEDVGMRIDYLELRREDTLETLNEFSQPAVLAGAVFLGEARLIDNILLTPGEDPASPPREV